MASTYTMNTTRSSIKALVDDYLRHRRGMGYAMTGEGTQLLSFARFADGKAKGSRLTRELMEQWAQGAASGKRSSWARRLEVLMGFARYRKNFEPSTELPIPGLFGPAHVRKAPQLYADAEVEALIQAARMLPPSGGIRAQTYAVLIGLLACTGLRLGEALRLQLGDVDLDTGVLFIRDSKGHSSRYVPLHPTSVAALQYYAAIRLDRFPLARSFFVSTRGTSPDPGRLTLLFVPSPCRSEW